VKSTSKTFHLGQELEKVSYYLETAETMLCLATAALRTIAADLPQPPLQAPFLTDSLDDHRLVKRPVASPEGEAG
jgi:hypothetical protein